MTKKFEPHRWLSAVRKLQITLANSIGRAFKMREHSCDDAGNDIKRWAVESAILRKRMQCERNALALARVDARLVQSTTQGKANTLPQIIHGIPQHRNSDDFITAASVQGVERTLSIHDSSSI